MSINVIMTASFGKGLATHLLKWLTNLSRAKRDRQVQSIKAVNKVVSLIRKTTAYLRGLRVGKQDFGLEAALAEGWSDLAHELAELKLDALAKKCDITGRYWADSNQFTLEFMAQADISFKTVEKMARDLVIQIRINGNPS